MNKKKLNLRFGIIAGLMVLAALSRLLPHPPNFTPIGGMALFGAAYFTKKYWAFIIPLIALWVSDLLINNIVYPIAYPQYYEGFTFFTQGWYWNYGAFILIALMGFAMLKKVKPTTVIGSSLVASVLFFLVTNFGTWMSVPIYPKTMEGLMASFTAGIPFFWNTVGGDLFYTIVLFGVFEWIKSRNPSFAIA